jgi:hypothetical protein
MFIFSWARRAMRQIFKLARPDLAGRPIFWSRIFGSADRVRSGEFENLAHGPPHQPHI